MSDETPLYRVRFRYLNQEPVKPELPLDEVEKRLQRMDASSKYGAWTLPALRLIESEPGVAARHLAPQVGQPLAEFKANVRKLKGLGLTVSLETGYELSSLGQSYLDTLSD